MTVRRLVLAGVLVAAQVVPGVNGGEAWAQTPPATHAPSSEPTAPPASGRQLAGATLALVSLAAAGAGVFFTARVDRLEKDIEQSQSLGEPIPGEQIDEKVQAGERAERWQWVGYGTALAAGIGAALLLLWPDRRSDEGGASLRVAPSVSSTGAGASLRLAF